MTTSKLGNHPSLKMQSLREILLKATALNFESIFLDTDLTHKKGILHKKVLKKGIRLPPNLFEDIQLKGKEIGWNIPAQFLTPCLPHRDELHWTNLNLLNGYYLMKDLVKIADSKLPLKELSIRVKVVTHKLINLLNKFSQTLEILHLGCFIISYKFHHPRKPSLKMDQPLRFPKLKKLVINFNIYASLTLAFFDFTYCAETLESIEIIYFSHVCEAGEKQPEIDYFLNSFAKLRNLISCIIICLLRHYEMLNSIKHFENLRCLNVIYLTDNFYEIFDFENSLPHLKYFSVMKAKKWKPEDFIHLEAKKLKYLGIFHFASLHEIDGLAETVGGNSSLDSRLTNFEYSTFSQVFYPTVIGQIYKYVKMNKYSVTPNQWQRLETLILILLQRYWVIIIEDVILLARYFYDIGCEVWTWTEDFKKKFANLIVNYGAYLKDMEEQSFTWIYDFFNNPNGKAGYPQILSFMVNQITMRPCTVTSKSYLKFLILITIYTNTTIEDSKFVDIASEVEILTILSIKKLIIRTSI